MLYEYIDKSVDDVSKRLDHHIESSAATVESSFATLNNHILENRKDIQMNSKKLSDLSAKAGRQGSGSATDSDATSSTTITKQRDTFDRDTNLRSRETASKRLAKRLALELKRHESGYSSGGGSQPTSVGIEKDRKIHLHRSGSVTITGNNIGRTLGNAEQKQSGTSNNSHMHLDDELDNVLAQISQVHKMVNSTNEQFSVLQEKLKEGDKTKVRKKKKRVLGKKKRRTAKSHLSKRRATGRSIK